MAVYYIDINRVERRERERDTVQISKIHVESAFLFVAHLDFSLSLSLCCIYESNSDR